MTPKLGEILVQLGHCTQQQVQDALSSPESRGGRLGTVLLQQGALTVSQLGEGLAEQFHVPFRQIEPQEIHLQAVRLLPERLARERQMAPVGVKRGVLSLAMAAPDDMEAISEVELITGYRVEPEVALLNEINSLLDRGFDERNSARQTIVDMKLVELREKRASGGEQSSFDAVENDSPVVKLVRSILMGAVNAKASDIHLEPYKPQMRVRYRVDGQLQQIMHIPPDAEDPVVGRIKVMANMDTTEKRKPQDGNLTLEEKGVKASFRVSTIPVVGGEKVVMRVIDEGTKVFTFDGLGMPDRQIDTVKRLIDKPYGMIVVTGPTGSGKTTTMYTMLMNIDAAENNISTVEDPVEHKLPGINQVHANPDHGMGFANALKYLMRQDPDIILVGEIRDAETATTAVQAALTGHLLISTLHTNDSAGAIQRLEDLGIDRFKIAGSLLASIAQRLLRKICPHCKAETPPNPEVLQRLLAGRSYIQIPQPATFFAGKGCPKCLTSGYSGRVAVYEVMEITSRLEKAIEAGASHSQLREMSMEEGMIDLAAGGMERALAGQTTVEEVYFKLST